MEKTRLSVKQLLEWAFAREYAQLTLPDRGVRRGVGFGIEYVLMQRAALGASIDSSRGVGSDPHEDAEVVAGVVARLKREVAILVAQVARSGLEPDWMPGAVAKAKPREWVYSREYGRSVGRKEKVGVWIELVKVRHPKSRRRVIIRKKRHDLFMVPITYDPHPETIRAAREEYELWAEALHEVHAALQDVQLRKYDLSDQLPDLRPWETAAAGSRRATSTPSP